MVQMVLARRNAVLAGVPDEELAPLLPSLQDVDLAVGQQLHRSGPPPEAAWFPLDGVVSLAVHLGGAPPVEVATVGREGMVGLSVALDVRIPTDRAVVQVAGRALRVAAEDLARVSPAGGAVAAGLHHHGQALVAQLARNAACNRVHPVRLRAARWLLTAADRCEGDTFGLTQDALAQALAVRRATVSDVAKSLADDGAIRYTRGQLTVLDRERLHAAACDCYDAIRGATAALLGLRPAG